MSAGPQRELVVRDGGQPRTIELVAASADDRRLSAEPPAIAVLPMRLNEDALPDLVVLEEGAGLTILLSAIQGGYPGTGNIGWSGSSIL